MLDLKKLLARHVEYAAEYLTRAASSFFSLIALVRIIPFLCRRSRSNAHIFTAPLPRDEQEEILRLAPSAKKPISCEHRDEKPRKR